VYRVDEGDTMASTAAENQDQADYWGSSPGRSWVEFQEDMDAALGRVHAPLLDQASPRPGERILDVGCGAGATSFLMAEAVGPGGHVTGADISPLLLDHARRRTPATLRNRVDFVEADAQIHVFPSRDFDLLVSRFGVMFFADPVAAFANLRRAMRPGGRLAVATWGPADMNPWFAVPRAAAIAELGPTEPVPPDAPGPLAFADGAAVSAKLERAGWSDVAVTAVPISIAPRGGAEKLGILTSRIGPAARLAAAAGADGETLAAIIRRVVVGMAPYAVEGGYEVPGVVNLFTARAP
jgi:SAM-dependent methyltransferase